MQDKGYYNKDAVNDARRAAQASLEAKRREGAEKGPVKLARVADNHKRIKGRKVRETSKAVQVAMSGITSWWPKSKIKIEVSGASEIILQVPNWLLELKRKEG